MSQVIKTKKIGKSAKKIKPSRNINKAMKSLSKKREPGVGKGAVRKKDLNITERKKAEEDQIKNNIRLDLAIDASQIGVWELDLIKDTSVRNLRHDQIFGYKEKIAEWGAKIFFEHIITEDRPSVQAAFDKAMKTDKLFFECRILWPDKSIHWITATGKTVRDSAGKPQKIFGTVTDITERKEVAEGLEKTRKELAVIKKSADEASEFAESLINTVREPLIALDQDLRVVSVSRSFYDFFKVKPEDTMGQLIYDLGNKQWDIPKLRELLETILPQKASFDNYEVEHEFATIGRRVMLLNARQIQQAFGKERIILLAIEDITEHKRLEILLTESEELYRGVFKTASDGIVLLEKREGKITHTNPAAEKMLGYSIKECIGNKLQDIGFMLDLGDFQTTMQNLNKNGIINYEDVPVKTKSGQHIDTDIYLVDKTKVVQCNIRDITDRTRAEEAIKKISSHQEALLSAVPNIIMETDIHKVYTWANSLGLEFFGEDVIGKEAAFYFSGEQNTYEVVKPLFYGDERVIYVESWQRRCDGEKRLLAWWSRGLKDGSGNVTGTVSSARDITELKLAEKKIKNSLAEKEILLKEVHHRVKNNLMIIISLIKMEETKADNEMFNPLLQELEGRIRSMAQVHESLYKSEDLAHIDLQNYIETMSSQIRAQYGKERDIRFQVQAVGMEVGLEIAVPCGLILNELITNAYKHAFPENKPRPGAVQCEINVIAGQDGGELTLTVANNGVGLPADLNLEKSETLGLRLVKMLIQQINGSIELDRSAGTVFRLKFPVA